MTDPRIETPEDEFDKLLIDRMTLAINECEETHGDYDEPCISQNCWDRVRLLRLIVKYRISEKAAYKRGLEKAKEIASQCCIKEIGDLSPIGAAVSQSHIIQGAIEVHIRLKEASE
jgi:hypothetical protein